MSHIPPAATVRTHLRVPLRFADGYATTARLFTFNGLVDGREHLALGLGDRAGDFAPDGHRGSAPLVRPHSECLVCGALGAWAAGNSSLSWQASDRVVGVAGILAFILAAIALGRRSWARLPLLAACVFADMLTWTVYFDWSDGMTGFAYLGLSYLIILAAGLALVVSIVEYELDHQSTTP